MKLLQNLGLRLGVVMLFYQLSRLLFWLINRAYFTELGLDDFLSICLYGIRFDASLVCLVNLPYIVLFLSTMPFIRAAWYRGLLNVLFLSTNGLCFIFDLADIGYFPYVRKRMNADVVDLIGKKSDFLDLMPSYFREFWYVFLLIMVLTAVFILLIRQLNKRFYLIENQRITFYRIGIILIVAGLSVLLIRGGFQLKPLQTIDAMVYVNNTHVPLVVNTPFQILHSFELRKMQAVSFMSEEEVLRCYHPVKQYHTADNMKKDNIVLIVLESFGKGFTGLGGRESFTPFLDSLARAGLVFQNAYANAFRSADGIPACVAGIPHFMADALPNSPYAAQSIDALPLLLKPKGYTSVFFHGGTNGTMNFNSFAGHAGFDAYKGRSEYGHDADYDGTWGIWDGPFLQYTAHELGTMKSPFFATLFTLSSHEPFAVPATYQNERIRALKGIKRGIAYSDEALRDFFASASKQAWYKNTLFVITADHNYMACSDSLDFYNKNLGLFSIPVLFFHPGNPDLKGLNTGLFQQIDIPATVLDYLQYPGPFFSYGKSGFDTVQPAFGFHLIDNYYYFRYRDRVVAAYGEEIKATYSFSSDSTLQHPLPVSDSLSTEAVLYYRAFRQLLYNTIPRDRMNLKNWQASTPKI